MTRRIKNLFASLGFAVTVLLLNVTNALAANVAFNPQGSPISQPIADLGNKVDYALTIGSGIGMMYGLGMAWHHAHRGDTAGVAGPFKHGLTAAGSFAGLSLINQLTGFAGGL